MPIDNQTGTLIALIAIAILLAIIVVLMLLMLMRKPKLGGIEAFLMLFDEAIKRLDMAIHHHVDVNAVVDMINQLDTMDADTLTKLQEYPEKVRAAAWLHYINCLGADLQKAQKKLSDAQQTYHASNSPTVRECQASVNAIRDKLDTAIKASGQGGIHIA